MNNRTMTAVCVCVCVCACVRACVCVRAYVRACMNTEELDLTEQSKFNLEMEFFWSHVYNHDHTCIYTSRPYSAWEEVLALSLILHGASLRVWKIKISRLLGVGKIPYGFQKKCYRYT